MTYEEAYKEITTVCYGMDKDLQESIESALEKQIPIEDKSKFKDVVHGEWKLKTEPLGWDEIYCAECSICGESWTLGDFDFEDIKEMYKFCPHCGADMRGEDK